MRIDNEIKLDYNDVLLRPKRSTLTSRKDVDLERTFRFYHSPKEWTGIPIMTANMASSGTFEIAKTLAPYKIITTFHKYYSIEDYKEFFKDFDNPDYISYSLGIRDEDFNKLYEMKDSGLLEKFSFICIDVPNGYLERFLEKLKELRNLCPEHIIIAGNVVTNEITEEIILNGADLCKIGIGPGCFLGDTLVRTKTGMKKIKEISENELVLTHKNRYQKVVATQKHKEQNNLICIDGVYSTPSHKYYVINLSDKNLITEKNIEEYAFWLEAENINKDIHMLVQYD